MNKVQAKQLGTAIGWCAVAIGVAFIAMPFIKFTVYTVCKLWGAL